MTETEIVDRAGRTYWDAVWDESQLPPPFDPYDTSMRNHLERRFHKVFAGAFAGQETTGQALLEVGAGRSRWLPYFAREFGFKVTGIDYSRVGCEQAKAILRQAGVNGSVIEADLFDPPAETYEAFDVVVSLGLVEHFDDTTACVAALTRFLRPGGLMITSIPNMTGVVGWAMRHVCRSIYDVHVPLDREALRRAHAAAGLTVLKCGYFLDAEPTAVNLSCWSGRWFYPIAIRLPYYLTLPIWTLDEKWPRRRWGRLASRYIVCLARK